MFVQPLPSAGYVYPAIPDSASVEPLAAIVKPPVEPPWKNTVEPAPGQYARVGPETVKLVGADGAVPSTWSVALWTDDASPRLSIEYHLIVCGLEIE